MKGNIVWNWRNATFGLIISLVPAIIIVTGDASKGLALLIGALPGAVAGLAPTRKARRQIIIIGLLLGVCIMLGSVVAKWPTIAVVSIFAAAFAASLLTARKPVGTLVMTLCVPLIGIGFSYGGIRNSIGIGVLLILGSAVAYLWSLLFAETKSQERPQATLQTKIAARDYGIRLGLAGAIAAALGFISGTDHVGWIVGAALLVMRPSQDMQELRSFGRIVSVVIGALTSSWLLSRDLPLTAIALVGAAAIIGLAATRGSRWYITPAFTTFLVFWSILYGDATHGEIQYRFWERVLETLAGVAIAYFFGLLLPKLLEVRRGAS